MLYQILSGVFAGISGKTNPLNPFSIYDIRFTIYDLQTGSRSEFTECGVPNAELEATIQVNPTQSDSIRLNPTRKRGDIIDRMNRMNPI